MVHGLRLLLLGRPAIDDLQLFSQIDAVPKDKLNDARIYADSGLGKLKGWSHQMHLRDNAVAYSLTNPCRVLLPWFDQVVAYLRHMEILEIICKVDEPMH